MAVISADYVVIGAGFAGAATAYHLARRGARNVLLLEQEQRAGLHASGRNASMIRQVAGDPELTALARQGAAFLRRPPPDWPRPVEFEQNGSLLLGSGEDWEALCRDAETARRLGIEVEIWPLEKTHRRVPALRGARFDGAVWCATDGVVNIASLLSGYLQAASSLGVRIAYKTSVRQIEVAGGRVREVTTSEGRVQTGAVVNAAGPWAAAVAAMAGAAGVPMRPYRRHLFVTAPLAGIDPRWPFTWDVGRGLYFRPESRGLLLCACDEDEAAPGIPEVQTDVQELVLEKTARCFPALPKLAIDRGWAGLRTISGDGRFVIGWDPLVGGFFWVAGLGGHGVTASYSAGELAARLILNSSEGSEPFSPARFTS
jgi:glycine/D-amino acid oxidase-like deaminating enzyme